MTIAKALPELTPRQLARFWSHVEKADGCWEWTGTVSAGGRAAISFNCVSYYAYRVSYMLAYGPVPVDLLVCHRCDNPLCVRPDHLFLGTHADNAQDCRDKGRNHVPTIRDESNPRRLFSDREVQRIVDLYRTGDYTQAELAAKFGISSPSTIGRWARGEATTCLVDRPFTAGKGRNALRQWAGKPSVSVPCSVVECQTTAKRKGLCDLHYMRAWKESKAALVICGAPTPNGACKQRLRIAHGEDVARCLHHRYNGAAL